MRSNEPGMDASNEHYGCLHPGRFICMQTYAANAATARMSAFELLARLIILEQSYEDACGECRDSENVSIRAVSPAQFVLENRKEYATLEVIYMKRRLEKCY